MQALFQKRTIGANAFTKAATSSRPVRVCKRVVSSRNGRASRRAAVECQAFFNFFTPKPATPAPIVDPRAKPLVEQLIGLTTGTDAGAKATPAQKDEIAAVITELSRYGMKAPLKSDLLFGEWKVLFSSKPTAVGGPLRSGAGPAVFPGQRAKQILEAPNKLVNVVEYKTLGFLSGFSRQNATIEPISADTFILNITDGEISTGLGGPIKKTFDIKRKIKILYLDDEIRVALFLPDEALPDTEAEENGGRGDEDVVFVFQRVTAEAEEAAGADDGDAGEEAAPKPVPFFGGGRKLESAATVAERQVRQQLKEQRGGSSRVAVAPARIPAGSTKAAVAAVPAAPRPGTQRGGRRQAEEEVEEDPRERRRREQEEERARKAAEAEAKAAEAKASRERAEAERQAEREKQAAIKELLAQLADEIKERQAQARDALKELKDVEKSTASGLKESQAARARLEEAEGDVRSIGQQLEAAGATRKEAEKAARDAKDVVVAAEKELRARIAAAAPVIASRT